jgi:DnaJ family protein C protein 28
MSQGSASSPASQHPTDRESLIDRIIREAQASGAFDGLPGAGKPLELGENPHTPREWRLAFHILENAGYKPAWIEKRKSIEADLESAREACRRSLKHATAESDRRAALECFKVDLQGINKRIDSFNLEVPLAAFQMPRTRIERELQLAEA